MPSLRRRLITTHRWLGLAAGAFWLIQAITGTLIVFHWELSDVCLAAPHRATDLAAIGRTLDRLAPSGSARTIGSVWTSGGAPDRWDVAIQEPGGGGTSVRIDGAGTVLRTLPDGLHLADGAWIDILVGIHQRLLGGDTGSWIVGVSGILLLSNLLLGLCAAWPRRGQWRRALTLPANGPPVARFYGWHRALGLWVMVPASLIVLTGILGVFGSGFAHLVGADTAAPVARRAAGVPDQPFARIIGAALARHPHARVSGINFPGSDDALYEVRLLPPGAPQRIYGRTSVFVRRDTGAVVADRDQRTAPFAERIVGLVFPVHTGEVGGMAGRVAAMAIGLWLATMILLGASLWWKRTNRASGKRGAVRAND